MKDYMNFFVKLCLTRNWKQSWGFSWVHHLALLFYGLNQDFIIDQAISCWFDILFSSTVPYGRVLTGYFPNKLAVKGNYKLCTKIFFLDIFWPSLSIFTTQKIPDSKEKYQKQKA